MASASCNQKHRLLEKWLGSNALGHQFQRANLFLANGKFLDEVGPHFESSPNGFRYLNFARSRNRNFRLYDVFRPVTAGCGNISRQAEVFQRGQSDVVCPSNSSLEHSTAPDRNSSLVRSIVDSDCFAETTYATNFDIDDPARLH